MQRNFGSFFFFSSLLLGNMSSALVGTSLRLGTSMSPTVTSVVQKRNTLPALRLNESRSLYSMDHQQPTSLYGFSDLMRSFNGPVLGYALQFTIIGTKDSSFLRKESPNMSSGKELVFRNGNAGRVPAQSSSLFSWISVPVKHTISKLKTFWRRWTL